MFRFINIRRILFLRKMCYGVYLVDMDTYRLAREKGGGFYVQYTQVVMIRILKNFCLLMSRRKPKCLATKK